MREIDRPIFLIGTGRCGSSILFRMLAYHPDVAWMSHYTSYLPGAGRWALLSRVHDLPGLVPLLSRRSLPRWVPQPTENYRRLAEATDGLFTAPRPLSEHDVTPSARRRLRALVRDHLAAQGKKRFVMKHTGFPRVRYLREVFPDAQFVHVVRDGRAVASSLCHVGWWAGESAWGWGELSHEAKSRYEREGYHELVLAAMYWKALMHHLDEVPRQLPASQLLELRYDRFTADPRSALKKVAKFADLPWNPAFARRVQATAMTSDDTKWRRLLTPKEQRLLDELLGTEVARRGFSAAA